MLTVGAVFIGISFLYLAWGVRTEFLQSRDTGPIAIEPTLPFALQSSMLLTLGLFIARKASGLPWWACLGAGFLFCLGGVGLIAMAGRMGRARRDQLSGKASCD